MASSASCILTLCILHVAFGAAAHFHSSLDVYSLLQVSHHPPISAGHAENDKWVYDIVSAPSTKFLGNSVEIYPVGARLSGYLAPSVTLSWAECPSSNAGNWQ